MVEALMLALGVLAILVFLLLGIVVELCRDVRQLREVTGILDRPLNVEIGDVAGTRPSSHGLPADLDSAAAALVLFLSDRCATCHALAARLGSAVPEGLWIILEARSRQSAEEFLASHRLSPESTDGRLCVDAAGNIAEKIGLRTTPVGFRVENGCLVSATTVPSSRYLSSILPNPVHLERSSLLIKERMPA